MQGLLGGRVSMLSVTWRALNLLSCGNTATVPPLVSQLELSPNRALSHQVQLPGQTWRLG